MAFLICLNWFVLKFEGLSGRKSGSNLGPTSYLKNVTQLCPLACFARNQTSMLSNRKCICWNEVRFASSGLNTAISYFPVDQIRHFILSAYPLIKKSNPDLPVLIREAKGTPARAFARFGTYSIHYTI